MYDYNTCGSAGARGEGKLIVTYKGRIIDLTGFKHPGGNFLANLNGKDITGWVYNAHYANEFDRLEGILFARAVDGPDVSILADGNLQAQAQKAEMFVKKWGEYSAVSLSLLPLYFGRRAAEFFLVMMCCWYRGLDSWLSFMGLALLSARTVYLMHDFGHYSVFQKAAWDRFFCRIVSILVLGFDLYPTSRTHFIHHAFPNVLEVDTALDTTPYFFWDRRQVTKDHPWINQYVKVQWLFWYIGLVLLSLFVHARGFFRERLFKAVYAPFVLLFIIRWVLLFYIFGPVAWKIVVPMAIGVGIPSYVAQLSHFHMPKSHVGDVVYNRASPFQFAEAMAVTSQDVRFDRDNCMRPYDGASWKSRFLNYVMGGLDTHITHHIFSAIHSDCLPVVNADCLRWLREDLGLSDLAIDSLPDVVKFSLRHIRNPFGISSQGRDDGVEFPRIGREESRQILKMSSKHVSRREWLRPAMRLALIFSLVLAAFCISLYTGPWAGTSVATVFLLVVARVKVFDPFHDGGHSAYVPWRRANLAIQFLLSPLWLMSPYVWNKEHDNHHHHSNNLDMQEDMQTVIWTLDMWKAASPVEKCLYFFKHGCCLRGWIDFVVYPGSSVYAALLNPVGHTPMIVLSCIYYYAVYTAGFMYEDLISMALFYQVLWIFPKHAAHSLEDMYRVRGERWTWVESALYGSARLEMPRPISTLLDTTAYYHAYHHVNPRIPSYALDGFYDEAMSLNHELAAQQKAPLFPPDSVVTFWPMVATLADMVYDPRTGRLLNIFQLLLEEY